MLADFARQIKPLCSPKAGYCAGLTSLLLLAGAGSVRGYQVHQVSNRTLPSKNMFVTDPTAPADIISMVERGD